MYIFIRIARIVILTEAGVMHEAGYVYSIWST